MSDLYFSVDVESDGPIPGQNSMLNFGCALFSEATGERVLETFNINLATLPGAHEDPHTAAWWKTQPEAWEAIRKDQHSAAHAMAEFYAWVKQMEKKYDGRAVCVVYPAGYDWVFLYWYFMTFTGMSPFGFSALIDVKTLAWEKLRRRAQETGGKDPDIRGVYKGALPAAWRTPREMHTHVGVDDAVEQGIMFMRMLNG